MTISSQTRKAGPFTGNDSAVDFPFSFKVFKSEDLLVVRRDANGIETALGSGGAYTVTLNADQNASPGGVVSLSAALATGYTLTITSNLDYLQPTDLTNLGGFYPRVINDALDRLTIFVQQLAEILSRCLKLSISTPNGVKAELPVPSPLSVIGWNSSGNALENFTLPAGSESVNLVVGAPTTHLSTAQQTSFSFGGGTTALVYRNGAYLRPSQDYSIAGNTIVLVSGTADDDTIDIFPLVDASAAIAAHAASHAVGGDDPITIAQSQVTGLATALGSKADSLGLALVATSGLYSDLDGKPDLSALHSHSNKASLDKITESAGLPLWNGAVWPGGSGGGASNTDGLPEGSSNLYFNVARVRAALLDGLDTASSAVITATDSILSAFGKLQAQISSKQAALVSGTNIKTINGTSLLGGGDLTVSGSSSGVVTVIEWNGVEYILDSKTTVADMAIGELAAGVFLVAYIAGSSLYGRIVTTSGAVPTIGAERTLIASYSGYTTSALSVLGLSATSAIIGFRDASSYAAVFAASVSGTTITVGASSVAGAYAAPSAPYLVAMDSSKFVVAHTAQASGVIVFRAYTVSGTTLTAGTLNAYSTTSPNSLALNKTASDRLLAVFSNTSNVNTFMPLSLSGTTFTNGTATTFTPATSGAAYYHLIPQSGEFIAVTYGAGITGANSFTGADMTFAFAGGRVSFQPATNINTALWLISHSSARGFSMGGYIINSATYTAAITCHDYQGLPTKIKDTGGAYIGANVLVRFGGDLATKLCVFKNAAGTTSVRVLQERLV